MQIRDARLRIYCQAIILLRFRQFPQSCVHVTQRRRQLGKSESPMAQAGTSAFSAQAMAIQRTGTVQDTKERLSRNFKFYMQRNWHCWGVFRAAERN